MYSTRPAFWPSRKEKAEARNTEVTTSVKKLGIVTFF